MKRITEFNDFLQLREDFKSIDDIYNFLVEEYSNIEADEDDAIELLEMVENMEEDEFIEYYNSLEEDERIEFDELFLEDEEKEIEKKFAQIQRKKSRQAARTPEQKKEVQKRLQSIQKARAGRETRELKTAAHQQKRRTGLRGAFRKAKLKTSAVSKKLGLTKFEPGTGKAPGKHRLTKRGAFVAGAATVGGLALANKIRKSRKKGDDFSAESYEWIDENVLDDIKNISKGLYDRIHK